MWLLKMSRKDGSKFSRGFHCVKNAQRYLSDMRKFEGSNGFIFRQGERK